MNDDGEEYTGNAAGWVGIIILVLFFMCFGGSLCYIALLVVEEILPELAGALQWLQ